MYLEPVSINQICTDLAYFDMFHGIDEDTFSCDLMGLLVRSTQEQRRERKSPNNCVSFYCCNGRLALRTVRCIYIRMFFEFCNTDTKPDFGKEVLSLAQKKYCSSKAVANFHNVVLSYFQNYQYGNLCA